MYTPFFIVEKLLTFVATRMPSMVYTSKVFSALNTSLMPVVASVAMVASDSPSK